MLNVRSFFNKEVYQRNIIEEISNSCQDLCYYKRSRGGEKAKIEQINYSCDYM